MVISNPENLLGHPTVLPAAPWCRPLDTLALALLAVVPLRGLAVPLTRGQLVGRVAEFGEHLIGKPYAGEVPPPRSGRVATALVGGVYYQRTSRAVAQLEAAGILGSRGRGRRHGYFVTPEGFVSLILNLRLLTADPVFEPSEFELRREIIAAITLLLDGLRGSGSRAAVSPELVKFIADVDRVGVGGVAIMSDELFDDTFSILRLIARQRENVRHILDRFARAEDELRSVEPFQQGIARDQIAGLRGRGVDRALHRARVRLPSLSLRAFRLRYETYLRYLDALADVYTNTIATISLADYRHAKGRQ